MWEKVYMLKEEGEEEIRRIDLQNLALGENLTLIMYNYSPKKLWHKIMRQKYIDEEDPTRILNHKSSRSINHLDIHTGKKSCFHQSLIKVISNVK